MLFVIIWRIMVRMPRVLQAIFSVSGRLVSFQVSMAGFPRDRLMREGYLNVRIRCGLVRRYRLGGGGAGGAGAGVAAAGVAAAGGLPRGAGGEWEGKDWPHASGCDIGTLFVSATNNLDRKTGADRHTLLAGAMLSYR